MENEKNQLKKFDNIVLIARLILFQDNEDSQVSGVLIGPHLHLVDPIQSLWQLLNPRPPFGCQTKLAFNISM